MQAFKQLSKEAHMENRDLPPTAHTNLSAMWVATLENDLPALVKTSDD